MKETGVSEKLAEKAQGKSVSFISIYISYYVYLVIYIN